MQLISDDKNNEDILDFVSSKCQLFNIDLGCFSITFPSMSHIKIRNDTTHVSQFLFPSRKYFKTENYFLRYREQQFSIKIVTIGILF